MYWKVIAAAAGTLVVSLCAARTYKWRRVARETNIRAE